MATSEDDAATITLTTTELNPLSQWIGQKKEYLKEFTVFKTLAEMCLETKGVPNTKYYMFSLQLLC